MNKFLTVTLLLSAAVALTSAGKKAPPAEAPLETVTCKNSMFSYTGCYADCLKKGGAPECCTFKGSVTTCQCSKLPSASSFFSGGFMSYAKNKISCSVSGMKNYMSQSKSEAAEESDDTEDEPEADE